MFKHLLAAVFVSVAGLAQATDYPVTTTSDVVTGAWMDSFPAATNLAMKLKAPMVLFWANTGCPECGKLEDAVGTRGFIAWQKAHPNYVYCFVQGVSAKDVAPNAGAKEFAMYNAAWPIPERNTAAYKSRLTAYPFVCLWWPQADGTTRSVNFSGWTGKMLVAANSKMDTDKLDLHNATMIGYLAEEFEGSIEKTFGSYVPRLPGAFDMGDTEQNRLEAEASTPFVHVPLKRESGSGPATERLLVDWPECLLPQATYEVNWQTGEQSKSVCVSLDRAGAAFPIDEVLTLTLVDGSGATNDTSHVTFVADQPNGPRNPYFVGERTLENLAFDDWTLDYDLVTNKVAAGKADYVLAVVSGVMWCPYCNGMEKSLLTSEVFRKWLCENRAQLVLFQTALSPSDAYPGAGHLLTYAAGLEHIDRKTMVSGAGYLSRHGLQETDALVKSVHARCLEKTFTQWQTPDSTAVRLSQPTLLLIKNDRVVGRFAAWRTADSYVYDPAMNVARLDELLALNARDDEAADFVNSTAEKLAVNDTVAVAYQVNSAQKCFLLPGVSASGTVKLTAASSSNVELSLLADGVMLGTGTNSAVITVKKSTLSATKRLVVKTRSLSAVAVNAEIAAAFEPSGVLDAVTLPKDFAGQQVLDELDAAVVKNATVSKRTGALPTGLKLCYNAKTGAVLLYGTPTKAGVYTFTYGVTVTGTSGVKTVLDPVEVTVTVTDPKKVNARYKTALKQTVGLLATDSADGLDYLAGTLTFAQTAAGKLSARYLDSAGKATSFTGTWSSIDAEGTLSATLVKNEVMLELALDAEGALSVWLDGSLSGICGAPMSDVTRYDGQYTVTLPVSESTAAYPCTGTGTARMTIKKGTASITVTLPNGTVLCQSAVGSPDPADPRYLLLPVLRTTRTDSLSVMLRVREAPHAFYTDYEDYKQVRRVLAPSGVKAVWSHTGAGADVFDAALAIYGSLYDRTKTESNYLSLFHLAQPTFMVLDEAMAVKYKVTKSTGAVIGSMKLPIDGKNTTVRYSGVVLPGWLDCGCGVDEGVDPAELNENGDGYIVRPFASGTIYYKTRLGTRTVTASVPFNIN